MSDENPGTQFQPLEGDEENLWSVIEILEERGNRYKVNWEGDDPATGKPWAPSWVAKSDCTDVLIRDWKRRKEQKRLAAQNKKKAKSRASTASSSKIKRSTSTTTNTTRQTRQSLARVPSPSPSIVAPSPPRATVSRSNASRVTRESTSPSPQKRRRARQTSDNEANEAGPSRPRKRRKLQVEVLLSPVPDTTRSRQSTAPIQNADERGGDNGEEFEGHAHGGMLSVVAEEEKDGEDDGRRTPRSRNTDPRTKRPTARTNSTVNRPHTSTEDMERAPLKVGPPRHVKRAKKAVEAEQPPALVHKRSPAPRRSPHKPNSRRPASSHESPTIDRDTGPAHTSDESPEFPDIRSILRAHRVGDLPSSQLRRTLREEEEENTQEAAGLVPSDDERGGEAGERVHAPRSSGIQPKDAVRSPEVPPPKRIPRVPSSNDTFSREGIVPETQPSEQVVQDDLDDEPYNPTEDDLVPDPPLPRTPVRPPAKTGRQSSVVSKMKRRVERELHFHGLRPLVPVPVLSPSVFREYLPPVSQPDEIEEFSSPLKGSAHRVTTPTQDTIEDFDDIIDWNQGDDEQDDREASVSPAPTHSLGPPLDDRRRPAATVLSKASSPSISYEGRNHAVTQYSTHDPTHDEPAASSTTHLADADSQSQRQSMLNSQHDTLNQALEVKMRELSELESKAEQLQTRIKDLEMERTQTGASHAQELFALRIALGEKEERITALESQVVELQLKPAEMEKEMEDQRVRFEAEISSLTESLVTRAEQLAQLEAALVDLQADIENQEEENERLARERDAAVALNGEAGAKNQTDGAELTSAREKLAAMEVDAAALVEKHAAEVQGLQRRIKSAEDDRELFKEMYSKASAHASEMTQENKDLQSRATLAEGQVRDGLGMLRATSQGQMLKLQEELDQWKGIAKLLQEKDARTDDEIRRRAAEEPELRRKCETLQEENEELKRADEARSKQMLEMADMIARMKETVNGMDDEPVRFEEAVEEARLECMNDPSALIEQDSDAWYVCQYVEDGAPCHAPFPTAQDVTKHAWAKHYSELVAQ